MIELVISVVESHRGILPLLPPAVVTGVFPVAGDCVAVAVAAETAPSDFVPVDVPPMGGAASTNADAGNPPSVCASAAFSAYGTLRNRIRGCSSPPLIRTPSQRASPDVNRLSGRPSGSVAPSWTV